MGFFEHSKKAGRICILIITLAIAGTISIMAVTMSVEPVETAKELLPSWMIILMASVNFYFGQKQNEPT